MLGIDDDGRIRSIDLKPPSSDLRFTWICAVWSPGFSRFMHDHVERARATSAGRARISRHRSTRGSAGGRGHPRSDREWPAGSRREVSQREIHRHRNAGEPDPGTEDEARKIQRAGMSDVISFPLVQAGRATFDRLAEVVDQLLGSVVTRLLPLTSRWSGISTERNRRFCDEAKRWHSSFALSHRAHRAGLRARALSMCVHAREGNITGHGRECSPEGFRSSRRATTCLT